MTDRGERRERKRRGPSESFEEANRASEEKRRFNKIRPEIARERRRRIKER